MEKYPNLRVLRLNYNLLALFTSIRDQQTSRKDFILNSHRIFRLLLEEAISQLDYRPTSVITPTNKEFNGVVLQGGICGISILRAGSAMEGALRSILDQAPIGQILIQRDELAKDKKPSLFYARLPEDVQKMHVLLMDPMLATGGSVTCAIDSLLKSGVKEEKIVFVNLLSCPEGIDLLFRKFPNIKMVTGFIDQGLNENKYILPGLGDFGDLYFGTN
jgi:uracil phosphoribosyltransferase